MLDDSGRVVSATDADGTTVGTSYDARGMPILSEDADGNETVREYDAAGRLLSETDPNGNQTQYEYDTEGRLTVRIDAEGGRTTQVYDSRSQLTGHIDPEGNRTTFVHDDAGREIEREDALGNSLTYSYDARGLKSGQTDRLGRVKEYSHDDMGRLTVEVWKDSQGTVVNTLTFTYDGVGNLTRAEDDDGVTTMTYDALNRLESVADPLGVTLTYSYDAAGHRTKLEDSLGGVLTSTFDDAGQLDTRLFADGAATLMYDVDYTAAGRVAHVERYSDLTTATLLSTSSYGYDTVGRLSSLEHLSGLATSLVSYAYDYDAGGRLTTETTNGTTKTYAYDQTNQLTDDNGTTYSYDANGNRTNTGYSTGTGNRLTSDGVFSYTYDAEGNVASKSKGSGLETWYYSYDHNNRLLTARKTSDGLTDVLTLTYSYDAFGHRIERDAWESGVGSTTTRFVYDGDEIILDLDGSNALVTRYIIGEKPDEMVARIDASGNVSWYLTDRLGSVRDITDAGGTIQATISFTAFGEIASNSNPSYSGTRLYAGMAIDPATGLYGTPNRDYDPSTGRWLQTDFIWFQAGDANLYRYVGNNATSLTDPSGLSGLIVSGFGRAWGGGASHHIAFAAASAALSAAIVAGNRDEVQRQLDKFLLWEIGLAGNGGQDPDMQVEIQRARAFLSGQAAAATGATTIMGWSVPELLAGVKAEQRANEATMRWLRGVIASSSPVVSKQVSHILDPFRPATAQEAMRRQHQEREKQRRFEEWATITGITITSLLRLLNAKISRDEANDRYQEDQEEITRIVERMKEENYPAAEIGTWIREAQGRAEGRLTSRDTDADLPRWLPPWHPDYPQ